MAHLLIFAIKLFIANFIFIINFLRSLNAIKLNQTFQLYKSAILINNKLLLYFCLKIGLSRETKFRSVPQTGSPIRHNNCESKKFPSHEFIKPVIFIQLFCFLQLHFVT